MLNKDEITKRALFVNELLLDSVPLFSNSHGFTSSNKGGDPRDVVTSLDIEVNDFLKKKILETFPYDRIYSEEGVSEGEAESNMSGDFWTIDPIDGSSNFAMGFPHFAVCVGYVTNKTPLFGGAINPITKEMFTFQKGEGVFKNGVRIEPSENFSLERSVVSFNAGRQKENRDWMLMTLTKILHKVKSIKFLGSSALDLCYVGAGIMDATIYPQLSTFDVAFAIGFVRESGGVVVNEKFENLELSFEKQKVLAFKNQKAMESFRELLLMPH